MRSEAVCFLCLSGASSTGDRFPTVIILTPPSHSASSVLEGTVIKGADGDTIAVLDSSRLQPRGRLAGIDSPENGQPSGNGSKKRLSALVGGEAVRVAFDRYDRNRRIVPTAGAKPPDRPTCGKTLDAE
jgi:endonuclease YncB( thermonuclease family)